MDAHDLTLRLVGTTVPDGQLPLTDVADICRALQELNTRVSRLVAGSHPVGRTGEAAARVAELRFTGISQGSTVLDVGYGEANMLPEPGLTEMEDETAEKLWEIISGISTGQRPDWATEPVVRSALDLGDALSHASATVHVRRADDRRVEFQRGYFARGPWQLSADTVTEPLAVTGELKAVDLDSHRFRIRDDAGNNIPLLEVQNSEQGAALIGSRAVASGLAVRDLRGGLKAVTAATIAAASVPEGWHPGGRVDKTYDPAQRPDVAPIPGLTDAESDDFMAAISR